MTTRSSVILTVVAVCLGSLALAQPADPPLANWTAPPYWNPARARTAPEPGPIDVYALDVNVEATSLPSSPVPFVAIAPCRIVDTRVSNPDGFHSPNFADGETRTFDFPNSPGCTGLPNTSVAYSVNVQYRPMTRAAYITLFPTGTTLPSVSTLVGNPASWTTGAAIVPAGTSGKIDVYCQYAGRVVIDINGYYAPQTIVTTLNTLSGDLTLAAGSNVTITPSGQTLTIASTSGGGSFTLPYGGSASSLNAVFDVQNSGSGWGVHGTSSSVGVMGTSSGTGQGIHGETYTGSGVFGLSDKGYGVEGSGPSGQGVHGASNTGTGVYGASNSGYGVEGETSSSVAVFGISNSADGVVGQSTSKRGIHGMSSSGFGVLGESSSSAGVDGVGDSNDGVRGESTSGEGVHGMSNSGDGVYGESNDSRNAGVWGRNSSGGDAGYFSGHVTVTNGIDVTGTKNFRIDHPLDPANRYLMHAAVESDEVLNVYSGNVTTDDEGRAVVQLPKWFEAENTDFRYQLTCIGRFAQAIIERKVESNRFTIRTNLGGVEVSWQVTARRNDAGMRLHPFTAEREKPAAERGTYLQPEAYNQPEEKGVEWLRHPELMRKIKGEPADSATAKP